MDTQHRSTSPLPIPTELLHEILLLRLVDSLWSLIVDPSLDVQWDPISPLLHASSQIREVTADIFSQILDEPSMKTDQGTSTWTVTKYQAVLAELKRVKTLGRTGNPIQLHEPEQSKIIDSFVGPAGSVTSPLLLWAKIVALKNLHVRLFEEPVGPTTVEIVGTSQMVAKQFIAWYKAADTSTVCPSINKALFYPLLGHVLSLQYLTQHAMALMVLCFRTIEIIHILWGLSDEAIVLDQEQQAVLDETFQALDILRTDADTTLSTAGLGGWDVDNLSLSQATFDVIQFDEAVECLKPPAYRPKTSPLVGICNRLAMEMLANMPRKQKMMFMVRLPDVFIMPDWMYREKDMEVGPVEVGRY